MSAQQLAMYIAPKPGAFVSFFSAGYVLCSILRCPKRRGKTYHRLIVGMSLVNVVLSACIFWGTWAIPSSFPILGAAGTEATCSAQGFLIHFGFAASIYYCSLSLLALLAVRNDFDETRLIRYEPWFHGFAFAFPLATGIYGIHRHYFNPAGSWCSVSPYPPGCDRSDTCVYGHDIEGYRVTLFSAIIFCYIFATAAMIIMYRTVRRKEREAAILVGKLQYLERARRRRSRTAMWQAALYLVTFYAIYLFSLVGGVTMWLAGKIYFPIVILGFIFQSFQGFFNMLVYELTRLRSKQVRVDEFSGDKKELAFSATTAVDIARSVLEKSTKAPSERSQKMKTHDEHDFSIFDGTIDPSSPWADFLDNDDASDEEEDSNKDKSCSLKAHVGGQITA